MLGSIAKGGFGCLVALLLIAVAYFASVLFWSWLLMLAMGIWGPYTWGYAYTCTHWGLLAGLLAGPILLS